MAFYDGVILGLNELKKSKLHRKALLVISDGGENNSRYSQAELKRILEESDAPDLYGWFRVQAVQLSFHEMDGGDVRRDGDPGAGRGHAGYCGEGCARGSQSLRAGIFRR